MTTTAAPPHTGDRFAARTSGGPTRVGHLLLTTWAETAGRRGRPALCGKAARTWRRADTFDTHVPACQDCNRLAGIEPAPARPIVITPRRGDNRPLLLTAPAAAARPLDPQHAAAALPTGWRPRVSPADDYVPRAEEERDYARAHAHAVVDIAFPAWAPLTTCTP